MKYKVDVVRIREKFHYTERMGSGKDPGEQGHFPGRKMNITSR